jgi:hypothetical protein
MHMSTTVKVILGIVAGGIFLCLLLGAAGLILFNWTSRTVGQVIQSDPVQVSEIGGMIAEYDLPAGFDDAYSKQVAGFDLVAYNGQDGHSHVYFFQLPQGVHVDMDEIQRQLDKAANEPTNIHVNSRVVDQFPATICGQQTSVVINEGTNSEGLTYRVASAVFQGKGGQAMVVFERPTSSWDQAEVDAFLASIR